VGRPWSALRTEAVHLVTGLLPGRCLIPGVRGRRTYRYKATGKLTDNPTLQAIPRTRFQR